MAGQESVRSQLSNVHHAELRRLLGALDDLESGAGKIVELAGEPGIGKTRLIADLAREARFRGLQVQTGRSAEIDRNVPLKAIVNAMCRHEPSPSLADELPSDHTAVLRRVFAAVPAERDSGLADAVEGRRVALLRTLRAMLDREARDGLVVALDDFHWADDVSAELVEYLVRWPVAAPLLLIVAHRPRQASARLRSTLAYGTEQGTVEHIELGPLTLTQAADVLGSREADTRLADLLGESDGNPLYLQLLANTPACQDTDGSADERFPALFSAPLLGELETLSPDEAEVVTAASVLGDDFDARAISDIAGLSSEHAYQTLDNLVQRDLLRAGDGSCVFRFRHSVLRRVVYSSLTPGRRVLVHRRALALLSRRDAAPAKRAVHIERSLDCSGPDDLQVLIAAASGEISADPATAARWLRAALLILPPGENENPLRVEIMIALARAHSVAGQWAEAARLQDEILRLVAANPRIADAADVAFCAMTECFRSHYAEAGALLSAKLDEIPDKTSPEAVHLAIKIGLIRALGQESLGQQEHIDHALQLAREYGDQPAKAGALALAGFVAAYGWTIASAGETLAACALSVDALPDSEFTAHPEYLLLLSWGEALLGRQEAKRHFGRSISMTRRSGYSYALPSLLNGFSDACRRLGHLEEASDAAREAAEIASHINGQDTHAVALALQSLVSNWTDPPGSEGTIALAEQAFAAMPAGSCRWSGLAVFALASAMDMYIEPQCCVTLITTIGKGPQLANLAPVTRPVYFELLAAAQVRDGIAVGHWADRAKAVADALPLPHLQAYALVARAHAMKERGKLAAAAEHYELAADVFATAGMRCNQARTLNLAAASAVENGQYDHAECLLELAKKLASCCSAWRLHEDAEKLLLDLMRPRAAERQNGEAAVLSALTEREREIANIAGTGKKTREIAGELSLSPRTVDVHLTRIYRKLNLSSRAELARLMAEVTARS